MSIILAIILSIAVDKVRPTKRRSDAPCDAGGRCGQPIRTLMSFQGVPVDCCLIAPLLNVLSS